MAARRNPKHADDIRQKIRGSHLVRRMQQHIDGKIKLTMAQVRAIDILLRKIVPDLVQTSINAEHTHRYVVEAPSLLTRDEWLKKYQVTRQNQMKTIDVTPEPTFGLPAPTTKQ